VSDVELLVVRCGPYTVGVEAARVRRVRRAGEERAAALPLAQLLGLTKVTRIRARVLAVDGDAGERLVLTEGRIRWLTVAATELRALPASLRHFGAPDWWLGTLTLGEELVLLVDLPAAVA
jgi:hypothetical protein